MKTQFLSQEERDYGRKNFFTFTLLNGLGFGFLADTTVYLLAIYFGASNIQLGYISSLIYLSGVVLIVTPKMLAGRNLINVFFWSWFMRGVVCLINGLVLLTTGQTAVAIILISYTLFCIFRIIGSSLSNPAIQMVSSPSNLGETLTHNTAYNNFGSIFGRIASFIIVSISYLKGLLGLMVLQVLGIIFNSIACIFLKRIPCREKIDVIPGENIFKTFWKNIFNKSKRIPLMLYWTYLSLSVFAGFSIPLLRKIIGLEQNIIFLYTLTIAIATTISMYIIRPFIDRVASKPFVLITCICDIATFILWAFVKPHTPVYLIFTLGFGSMFTKGINQSMITKLLVSSIPHKEKVTYNSMIHFFAGVLAMIFGLLAGLAGDFG
jgi:hypothetical protein